MRPKFVLYQSWGSLKTKRVLKRVNTKTSRDKIKDNQINSVDPGDRGGASPLIFGLGGDEYLIDFFVRLMVLCFFIM